MFVTEIPASLSRRHDDRPKKHIELMIIGSMPLHYRPPSRVTDEREHFLDSSRFTTEQIDYVETRGDRGSILHGQFIF